MPSTVERSKKRAGPPIWIDVAVIVLVAAFMLQQGWRKWPDVMVDFGRELYVPWQLIAGKVLYTDIAYFNGPLSPYLDALWFRLFGVGLLNLALVNLAIAGAITALLHRILSAVAGRLSAVLGCVTFLVVFGLPQLLDDSGNYNYVTPYSHEVTHGMVLSLAALFLLLTHVRRRGEGRAAGYLFGAGTALGFVFLTKAEMFAAAFPAVIVGLGADAVMRGVGPARFARSMAGLIVAMLIPPLAALLLLNTAMPLGTALRGTLGSWPHLFVDDVTGLEFYRTGMGFDDPAGNLWKLVVGAFGYVVVFVSPAVVALRIRQPLRGRRPAVAYLVIAVLAGVFYQWLRFNLAGLARPFPLLVAVAAAVFATAVFRRRGRGEVDPRLVGGLSLAVFAFVLLLKMLLNARVYHYGFVLAMPAAMILVAALADWLPAWVRRLGGDVAVFRPAAISPLLVVLLTMAQVSSRIYAGSNYPIGEGRDAFYADVRGPAVGEILSRLRDRVKPDETLAVLPEGVMLNYQLRRENPTPYVNFMPPEVFLFGENRMIGAFDGHPPDWIVLTNRGAFEYGYRLLGSDYGVRLMEWVQDNYEMVDQVRDAGRPKETFSLALILRHKDGAGALESPTVTH